MRLRLLRTSSFRLTLVYAVLFALAIVALFTLVSLSATHFMTRQIDQTVLDEIDEAIAEARGLGPEGLRRVVTQMMQRSPDMHYLLQDEAGHVLAGNMARMIPQVGRREVLPRDGRHRAGIRGRGVITADDGYLFVGVDAAELDKIRGTFRRAFLWSAAGLVAMSLAAGLFAGLSVRRRIEAISRTSREIMAGDLGRRVPVHDSGDEFDHLATSLNAMLDRIQSLMGGLQQISNDIAHDMRTPLARLRQRLELALRSERGEPALRAAIEHGIGDVDGILDTFGALLRIAQIESGTRRAGFAEIDLAELLADLCEAYQPVAEETRHTLGVAIGDGLVLRGDRELLAQLFANLIENALRHTPAGTVLAVAAAAERGTIVASVADRGPGIPAYLHGAVLQRFYRLETSRTTPGSGLGLGLVQAIASLHGAKLELGDNAPGLRVTLRFEAARQLSKPAGWNGLIRRQHVDKGGESASSNDRGSRRRVDPLSPRGDSQDRAA